MTKEQDLIIKIKAETAKATKDVTLLTKQVDKLSKETIKVGKSSTGIDKVTKGFSGLSGTLTGLVAGFSAIAVGVKAVEFAKLGADAEQAADAFDRVFKDLGLNAVEEFDKIKAASQGLIPEAAIKQSAVTAASLGVPIEKLAELMEIARVKAREMGTDTKSAFNDLAVGIGRGSPMILDNLGLTIKLEDANKKYAATLGVSVNELTKQQKQIALTNAVIDAGATSVERFADAGLSASQKMQKMNSSIEDLQTDMGAKLVPTLEKLTESTQEWLDNISSEDLDAFGQSVETLVTVLTGMANTVKTLNDIAMPDWLGGKDSGLLGTVADGWGKIATIVNELTFNFTQLSDVLDAQKTKFDEVTHASMQIGKSAAEIDKVEKSVQDLIAANEKIISQDVAGGSIDQIEAAKLLEEQNKKLKVTLENLNGDRAFLEIADDTKEASEGIKEVAKETKKYTEKELKELSKLNDKRAKETEKTLKSLAKSEQKLADDIVKINQALIKDLEKIANDRFNMNQDIETQIADLKRGALTDDAAYYDRQKDAEVALSNAKLALKANEYEKYKTYIDQYKTLVTDAAGQEIIVNEKVLVTKEQTTKRAIAGLKEIQTAENAYYEKKKADAQSAHDIAIQHKQVELESIQAQLIGQKQLLIVVKELTEALTGKTVGLDTSAIDEAIAKIETTKNGLASLAITPTKIITDNTDLDTTKAKTEEIKTLAVNGIELEVTADTTAADFDIDKLITKEEGEEITMEVNPEYEEAERKLDEFRKQEDKPIEPKVELNMDEAKQRFEEFIKRTQEPSTHEVDADTNQALKAIDVLKLPTSSTHTVYVKEVTTRANGGLIPQRLAVGGSFTGSGRVPGYDPSDSDRVNALLTGGEFVIKRSAVDMYGTSFLNALNNMKLPKVKGYAEGGVVSPQTNAQMHPINLNISGQSFSMMGDIEVAEALQRWINNEGGL